ncbi:MAG: anhydro-N-acetylmuramic acid kinase, partial [Pseudomonadota bacterium]
GAVVAFDTGPANAPLIALAKSRRGLDFDAYGELAASGGVSAEILEAFARVAYFDRKPPKSLDRNDFGSLLKAVEPLTDADAAATLTAAVATSVARAEEYFPSPVSRILVSGGGRHNALLMEMIERGLECPVEPVEFVGFNGDMLEAEAFAYLAVRIARGLPTSFPMTTGVGAAVGGGEISTPR